MSRAGIAARNSFVSIAYMVLSSLLAFIYRTVLINVLGIGYVGITGLFTNVIAVFSLAELGIGWAFTYHLYKPLARGNLEQVAAIVNLLKKLYKLIGYFILVIGLCVLPFIQYLINTDKPIEHVHLLFFFFLSSTVLSYVTFGYYRLVLLADRKDYKMFWAQIIITTTITTSQILVLWLMKDFVLAVFIGCTSNFLLNLWGRSVVRNNYKELQFYKNAQVGDDLKSEIIKYVKATAISKFCLVIMNSSGGIIVSTFISTAALGLYSNYQLITDTIRSLWLSLTNPLAASIGELNAVASVKEKMIIYNRLNFLNEWVLIFCAVCLFTLINPFITLWIGNEYTFPQLTVGLFVLNFFVEFIPSMSTKFCSACGLNIYGKYRALFTAIINVILALILIDSMGVDGVLISLIFSRIATTIWYDPWLVYRKVFFKSPTRYYFSLLLCFLLAIIIIALTAYTFSLIWKGTMLTFTVGLGLCLILPNMLLTIVYCKSEHLKYYLSLLRKKIK